MPADRPESLHHEIAVKELSDLHYAARYIRSIFSLVEKGAYQSSVHEKRYKVMKIIMSLISDIKIDKQADTVFDVLIDILLFLFNAESISILVKNNNVFTPLRTGGRLKEYLKGTVLRTTGVLSEVIERRSPFYTESAMDILQYGIE